jgi:ubiquitin conjugation factor E4 B
MQKLSGPPKPKPETPAEGEASGSSTTSPPPPPAPQSVESTPKPKITVKAAPSPAATSDNPFAKLTSRSTNGTGTPPVSSTSGATLKRHLAEDEQSITKVPIKKTSIPPAEEDIDSWESRIIGKIFRITLDPDQKVDGSNHKLIFLPQLRQELEDENLPVRLSAEKLDAAILEACSTIPHNKPVLDYLLPCWKRILKEMRGLRGYANAKDTILKEAKRLCMSNCIFAAEIPGLFGLVFQGPADGRLTFIQPRY